MKRPILLLLSATSGYGHVQAGMSLARSLRKLVPEWDVRHENLCDYASPLQRWSIERLWQAASTWPGFRSVYGWLHRWVVTDDLLGSYFSRLYRPIGDRLAERYAQVDVAGVVALHPGAACAAVWWKRRQEFYLGVVATDLVVHSLQVLPGVDAIFADCRSVFACPAAVARKREGRINLTGLPVGHAFFDLKSQAAKTAAFHVVVSFGAKALRAAWHLPTLMKLVSEQTSLTFTFVCGHDRRLRARVEYLVRQRNWSKRVEVVGFARNMPELLRKADVVIGKAGGISVGEVLAACKPLLIIEVLPGQEEYNAQVLEAVGAGRVLRDYVQLLEALDDVRNGTWRIDVVGSRSASGIAAVSMEIAEDIQGRRLFTAARPNERIASTRLGLPAGFKCQIVPMSKTSQ